MKVQGPDIVQFCVGCPAQQNYVGEVVPDNAEVKVEVPEATSTIRPDYVAVDMTFVDEHGGASDNTTALFRLDELREVGVTVTVKNHSILYRNRIHRTVEKGTRQAAPALVNRIGRCAHAGVDADGNAYCPAMAEKSMHNRPKVFEGMVKEAIESRLHIA